MADITLHIKALRGQVKLNGLKPESSIDTLKSLLYEKHHRDRIAAPQPNKQRLVGAYKQIDFNGKQYNILP